MKKEELLIERLKKYRRLDMYPFHMPGHKRAEGIKLSFPDPFSVDITEIDGFDNLHHPEGILKESMGIQPLRFGPHMVSCKWKYLWVAVGHQRSRSPQGKDISQPELP